VIGEGRDLQLQGALPFRSAALSFHRGTSAH
jgi:hypothetical protein